MKCWIEVVVLLITSLCPIFAGCAANHPRSHATTAEGELLPRHISIGGEDHAYAVWVPRGYDAARAWPCVVFLHGSGECGTDGLSQTKVGLGPAAKADPTQWACTIVMPQKPIEAAEWEEYEAMVLAELEATRKEFNIDRSRICLTGLSQGGHGSWMIGARHPDLWSAVAPVCGYGRPGTVAPRLVGMPVWAFHGGKDTVVPADESVKMVNALKAAQTGKPGPAPKLMVFPELNHNCWDKAYRESGLGEWLLSQTKR